MASFHPSRLDRKYRGALQVELSFWGSNGEHPATHAKRITLQEWKNRGLFERVLENIGWVFERQQ